MSFRKETLAEGIELYNADCREVLPTLGKVDAVVTDPPYGIGIAANPFRQKHEKKTWDDVVADLSFIPLADCPSIVWGGNYFGLPASQGFYIWDKVQPESFSSAQVEYAWSSMAKPAKLFRRHVVSFEKHHPTTKPLELMEWCIQQLPVDSTIVLDPFMGSGTTGVACVKLGRKFIGIEIEPKYFDIACKRISEALKQPDFFVEKPKPAKQEALI